MTKKTATSKKKPSKEQNKDQKDMQLEKEKSALKATVKTSSRPVRFRSSSIRTSERLRGALGIENEPMDQVIENPVFKVGDNAVYPAHGVAVIKRIEERKIGTNKKSFYVLQVLENQMTIMVPMDNAGSVGLREIISDDQVSEVYQILKQRDVKIDQTTWNRRYREYMEKIKTGSTHEIAEVLRNLFLLRHSKDLSFGERKMLDQAKQLLVKEISLAKRKKESEVDQEIQTIFAS